MAFLLQRFGSLYFVSFVKLLEQINNEFFKFF